MRQLEQSLRRLKTDYLDLWQIHECVYYNDPERHFMRGGVVEALERGETRRARCDSSASPATRIREIHLAMLAHDFPFDTCQLPLNCFDASFANAVRAPGPARIAATRHRADRHEEPRRRWPSGEAEGDHAEEGLRYAMSLPVATTVSGIDSMKVLRQNLKVAAGFKPMSERQMNALRRRVATRQRTAGSSCTRPARRWRDRNGRKQHGFPDEQELSA